jgi:hypothetical protein
VTFRAEGEAKQFAHERLEERLRRKRRDDQSSPAKDDRPQQIINWLESRS